MAIDQILRQCKTTLRDYYGGRFQGLVLYGSLARNRADAESDIDLLVLLNQPIDYLEEVRRIIDLLYPVQMESDRLISAKPVFLTTTSKVVCSSIGLHEKRVCPYERQICEGGGCP